MRDMFRGAGGFETIRRSLPVPKLSVVPRGSEAMCFVKSIRRFVAMRNADKCEHISPPMYTRIAAAAKSPQASRNASHLPPCQNQAILRLPL